jgi:hypothetical protein
VTGEAIWDKPPAVIARESYLLTRTRRYGGLPTEILIRIMQVGRFTYLLYYPYFLCFYPPTFFYVQITCSRAPTSQWLLPAPDRSRAAVAW